MNQPGLWDISREIAYNCMRWGRIHVTDYKEKYGEIRVYVMFGWYQVNNIFYPLGAYIKKPEWLMRIELPNWINHIVIPYQKWIYKRAYLKALKKYPEAKEAIISGMDYPELINIRLPSLCYTHGTSQRHYITDPIDCEKCQEFNKKLQGELE